MTKSQKAPKDDPVIRPGAGGHRFGPDLQCNECGRNWDEHQHDPSPCSEIAEVEKVAAEAPLDAGRRAEEAEALAEPGGDSVESDKETDEDP